MNRRTFLGVAAGLTLADAGAQTPPSIPIIDTHIHLFDTERPGGVPWPSKNNPAHKVMYMPSLPARYRKVVDGLGIVGAIEIECSALLEDNQWVLDVAKADDIMVGTIGHLTPGTPEFRPSLERFHKNPLFRGIRHGLGGRPGRGGQAAAPAVHEVDNPEFVADLKALADADLVMDTANPSVPLLEGVVRVSDKVPSLRIVIDHLPQMWPTAAERPAYDATMKAIKDRPQIYTKVSEVLRREADGTIPTDLAFYRSRIDEIVDVFGMDRVLYGSDWPNGDQWLPVPVGFKIVHEYFMGKGQAAAEKYFWRNSIQAYKWVKRNASQRQA
jgi:predicted TIM-barrel fold metal-dependent hydrolase